MAELGALETPFGRLSRELLGAARSPLAQRGRKRRQRSGVTPPPMPVVALDDPSPAVLDLVLGPCFQRYPALCALTTWHFPAGPAHTRLLFFLREPAAALRLLEEATHGEQKGCPPWRVPTSTAAGRW